MALNPWEDNDVLTGLKLGDPRSALVLADQHDIQPEKSLSLSDEICKSPSLKLIRVMKELSELRQKMDKIDYDVYRYMLDQSSKDFTHVNTLDSRLKQLNILLEYFTEVIKNTDRLVARLQKQSVDSSLNIEVQYHRHTVESLCSLTQILTNLPEHCKSIESLREFKFKDDPNMISKLSEVVSTLVECKISTQRLEDHFNIRYPEDS